MNNQQAMRQLIADQAERKIAQLEQDNQTLREALAEAQRRITYLEKNVSELCAEVNSMALLELASNIIQEPNGGG